MKLNSYWGFLHELRDEYAKANNTSCVRAALVVIIVNDQIFCTEPYRVPMAGKVDVCLFDKTGTLTTDELVAVGVEPANPASTATKSPVGTVQGGVDKLVPMQQAPAASVLVLAGCQSLVLMEGTETGDPVEAASMKAIKVSLSVDF